MKKTWATIAAFAFAMFATAGTVELQTDNVFGKPVVIASRPTRGHAVIVDGTRLYAGAGDRLFVFDTAADPLQPRELGHLDLPGKVLIRQLAVENGIVYVSAREGQMTTVDCRDGAHPKFLARYDCCELATGIDVAGGVCFLGQRQNGVEFIDVTDPARPTHIAMRKTEESQSVFYQDGYCYSGEWEAGKVTVFDCRDLSGIREVAKLTLYGYGDGIWAQGNLLYAATGHSSVNRDATGLRTFRSQEVAKMEGAAATEKPGLGAGHGLQIFDIADPEHPKPLGRVEFPPFYSRGFDFWTPRPSGDGRLVVSAQTFNGLFAVDVSNPVAPKVVDRIVFPGKAEKPGAPGLSVASVATGDGVVYAAVLGLGIVAVPAKGVTPAKRERGLLPKNASARETYPTDENRFFSWLPPVRGQLRGVAVAPGGKVVLAAAGDAGLYAVEASPGKGFGDSRRISGGKCLDVSVWGKLAVTAEGTEGGWGVHEVAADGTLVEKARIRALDEDVNDAFWATMVTDSLAVLAERRRVFEIWDLSDAARPKKVVSLRHICPGWDRIVGGVVDGRWFCWNEMWRYVAWCDLAAEKPTAVPCPYATKLTLWDGLCPFGGKMLVSRSDRYQFVPGGTFGDPAGENGGWTMPGRFPGGLEGGMPRTDGRHVLKTYRIMRQAAFYDFADLENPRLVWQVKLSGNPDAGVILGGKAVIPCGFQGLLMAK